MILLIKMNMEISSLIETIMTNTISGKAKRRKTQKYKRKQMKKLER